MGTRQEKGGFSQKFTGIKGAVLSLYHRELTAGMKSTEPLEPDTPPGKVGRKPGGWGLKGSQ